MSAQNTARQTYFEETIPVQSQKIDRIHSRRVLENPVTDYLKIIGSSEQPIEIRFCQNQADLKLVFKHRYEVFEKEGVQGSLVNSKSEKEISEPADDWGYHILVKQSEKVIGSARVNFSAEGKLPHQRLFQYSAFGSQGKYNEALVSRVIIDEEHRKGRLFFEIIQALYILGDTKGAAGFFIGAREDLAEACYRLGCRPYKEDVSYLSYKNLTLMYGKNDPEFLTKINSVLMGAHRKYIWKSSAKLEQVKRPWAEDLRLAGSPNPSRKEKPYFERLKQDWLGSLEDFFGSDPLLKLSAGKMSIETYKNFLAQTYLLIREHPQLVAGFTRHMKGRERKLVRKFLHHSLEEIGHENMAKNDLRELGVDVRGLEGLRPLPSTTALIGFIDRLMQFENPIAFIGYLFHFEMLPELSGNMLSDMLTDMGVPTKAQNYIKKHIEIDAEHSEEMPEYIEAFVKSEQDYELVRYAAMGAAKLHEMMIQECDQLTNSHFTSEFNWHELQTLSEIPKSI
jgi:pyrroloquinoline quinone (PQQ) biosynthesis protein C